MEAVTPHTEEQVRVFQQTVGKTKSSLLAGIQDVLNHKDPGWLHEAERNPGGTHAQDVDFAFAAMLANADVAKAMAAAGMPPDGTAMAKIQLLNAYFDAVVAGGALPHHIEQKIQEARHKTAVALRDTAAAEGALQIDTATLPGKVEQARRQAEMAAALAARAQSLQQIEGSGVVDKATAANERAHAEAQRLRLETQRFSDRTVAESRVNERVAMAEELKAERRARHAYYRAKAPDVLWPVLLLVLLLAVVVGVTYLMVV